MSYSNEPIIPIDPEPESGRDSQSGQSGQPGSRSQRRRAARHRVFPFNSGSQETQLIDLSRRAYPTIDMFVYSLACGLVLGLGFLLDSPAVLLLGVLVAPLMTPWVGLLLGLMGGTGRYLSETIVAVSISLTVVFISGLATGYAARFFLPLTFEQLYIQSRLWVPELVVVAIGAIAMVIAFIKSEQKPWAPSVSLAYVFFLPITATGFGLGAGLPGIWPQAGLVFLVHFALAGMLGFVTLLAARIRPTRQGSLMSIGAMAAFVVILAVLMGGGMQGKTETAVEPASTSTATSQVTEAAKSAATPTRLVTQPPQPSQTASATRVTKASITSSTPTASPPPSPTGTPTLTSISIDQLASGIIKASDGGGANLREFPNGKYIMTLPDGTRVKMYPDTRQANGVEWIRVLVNQNGKFTEGWLLASALKPGSPAASQTPAASPEPGLTPTP